VKKCANPSGPGTKTAYYSLNHAEKLLSNVDTRTRQVFVGETSCSYLHTAFSFASFTDFPSLVKWQVGKQTPSGRIERTLVFVGL